MPPSWYPLWCPDAILLWCPHFFLKSLGVFSILFYLFYFHWDNRATMHFLRSPIEPERWNGTWTNSIPRKISRYKSLGEDASFYCCWMLLILPFCLSLLTLTCLNMTNYTSKNIRSPPTPALKSFLSSSAIHLRFPHSRQLANCFSPTHRDWVMPSAR